MLENNRDEINFHKFLKSVRKSQGVSMEQVAIGVCTKSGMSRIESGTRLPDKLVRDRLTARLGISGEEYEEYLLPREYEQWECRMEIIRCINKKDIPGAEEKITAYADTYNSNVVDEQFAAAMKFMLMEMKGSSEEELFEQISETLAYTVPDIDAAFAGIHLLADQELNLIMEYIRLKKPVVPERNLTEWKLEEYHKIITYVENSRMDKIAQAKVYSKLACFASELILTEYATEESLRYALELCTRAVEVLRDTVRLYYFVELNEYRMKLIEKIREFATADVTAEEKEAFDELYHTSQEWAALFHEMYTENELPIYMENYTHLYTETECNNVRDVIRARRAMMGMSRKKFSGRACDERTLLRIEKEDRNPSMATVRDLFERMGLCAEYKRARVITSDVEAMYLSQEIFIELNDREYENAIKKYKLLCDKIDMDITQNEQEMRRIETDILVGTNQINKDDFLEMLIDTIECTVSMEAVLKEGEKFITRTELACVHDFAVYSNSEEGDRCRYLLENMCSKIMQEEIQVGKLYIYELIMCKVASLYGNLGRYEESCNISRKLLKESLRNKRMNPLTECEYNELWNYQEKMKKNHLIVDDNYVYNALDRAFTLSIIGRRSGWKRFFQQKLESHN